ncbi:RNA pyrophosphohydrolase [Campylobacter sp. 19-13652]|uniref:RNA pyrophosphohydrolase n=1 Tax=Campylobacter sp. 19-13652 TaxID=2840180 RepID=UPI001C763CAE|nr:RNA pyrophosphohydrolase [Campylobacter sp. 19-13652]BCX79665.1 RNA pyrophosphohydrolase [Campylobacter sp. 19-13652]
MQKKYRPNVAAVVLSSAYPFKCEVFLARRIDLKDVWQFPQGGIDAGESELEALKRELREEIGTDDVEVLGEYPQWLSYDFPAGASSKKTYNYDGQTQKYFLVRLRPSAKIVLGTHEAEFSEYKFVNANSVLDSINHFKKPIYAKVLSYFKEKGYI